MFGPECAKQRDTEGNRGRLDSSVRRQDPQGLGKPGDVCAEHYRRLDGENGSIVCGGKVPSWLSGGATFSDYALKLEFRGGEKVNSGVFLRSQKEGQPHITGYELQIWDYQPAGFLTGSLVGSQKAGPAKILPDQWNRYDITAQGDHFVIVLNGETVLDAHDAAHSAGLIGFQCQQDNRIEFRNIKLRPIKK